MTHHLTSEPIVTRNGRRFIDVDFGLRAVRQVSAPHVDGHETRRAAQRGRDPILNS